MDKHNTRDNKQGTAGERQGRELNLMHIINSAHSTSAVERAASATAGRLNGKGNNKERRPGKSQRQIATLGKKEKILKENIGPFKEKEQ